MPDEFHPYARALRYRFPLDRGEDVLQVQQRLKQLGYAETGQPDGLYGVRTERAVHRFQQSRGLAVDGVVGPRTWAALFGERERELPWEKISAVLPDLTKPHRFRNSIAWHLTPQGLAVEGEEPETTPGEPETVRGVWQRFGHLIEQHGSELGVPAELVAATICTESSGDPEAERREPGFRSYAQTPDRVSVGLMQTLIATAREALGKEDIDRDWLLEPGNSIRAGTAYIAAQWKKTLFDPPKVACAYNAGGVYHNDRPGNRWKMRQYPINTGEHADRFVRWFNDCFRLFRAQGAPSGPSWFALLREQG
jgi:hypothetical protein